jgi:CHAT domain-containing protein
VLMDGQALEPTILPRLERSRIVYIAGHATHDPEMPYRSYLPCAAGAGDRDPAHARLTCSDILERDLTGCELVVLSSCRSAAGRATRATVGPSLADVFADAGATGVVAARWGLADAAAADYMERFVDRWRGGDAAAAWDALTAVRRDYLRESAQPSLDWLAYELEFGRLPR